MSASFHCFAYLPPPLSIPLRLGIYVPPATKLALPHWAALPDLPQPAPVRHSPTPHRLDIVHVRAPTREFRFPNTHAAPPRYLRRACGDIRCLVPYN